MTARNMYSLLAGLFVFAVFGLSPVHADTRDAPNPDDFNPGVTSGFNDVHVVASRSGPTNGLDAPEATVLFYFDNQAGNQITIYNGDDQCGIPGGSPSFPGRPDGSNGIEADTDFTMYSIADLSSPEVIVLRQTYDESTFGCGAFPINIPAGWLVAANLPGTTIIKYVLRVTAVNNSPNSINGFRYRITGGAGQTSYYNKSGSKFALQDRNQWSSPSGESEFNLRFAPDCTVTSNTLARVDWFDDDDGGIENDIRMILYEDGNPIHVVDGGTPASGGPVGPGWTTGMTGNDNAGVLYFTAKPGAKYVWQWQNVDERNGIQFQMPYDSVYYYTVCDTDDDPVVNTSGNCTTISGTASDPDQPGGGLVVRLYRDAVAIASTTTNAAGAYSFNISSYQDFQAHTYTAEVQGEDAMGNPTTTSSTSTNVGPCSNISCGAASLSISQPEAGQAFTITVRFNVAPTIGSNGSSQPYTVRLTTVGTVPPYAATVIESDSLVPGEANEFAVSPSTTTLTPGVYNGSFQVVAATRNISCAFSFTTYNKPYVSVFGGDVWSGGTFSRASCNQAASINAFYDTASNRGSSSQFAVASLGAVTGFSSAKMRTTTPATPKGLTIANVAPGGGGTFGGNVGGSHCLGDYFAQKPSDIAVTNSSNYTTSAFATSRRLFNPPGGTLNLSDGIPGAGIIAVPNGVRHTIYVSGNLIIRDNIVFAGNALWPSIDDIPSLFIIVQGNIYIESDVTQIDAVLIAEPPNHGTPAGRGQVVTCTQNGVTVTASNMYNNCSAPLQINGAVVAQKMKLNRSGGSSLRFSQQGEFPYGVAHGCQPPALRAVCASETFSLGIETYLGSPFLENRAAGRYDSITSLPPVL